MNFRNSWITRAWAGLSLYSRNGSSIRDSSDCFHRPPVIYCLISIRAFLVPVPPRGGRSVPRGVSSLVISIAIANRLNARGIPGVDTEGYRVARGVDGGGGIPLVEGEDPGGRGGGVLTLIGLPGARLGELRILKLRSQPPSLPINYYSKSEAPGSSGTGVPGISITLQSWGWKQRLTSETGTVSPWLPLAVTELSNSPRFLHFWMISARKWGPGRRITAIKVSIIVSSKKISYVGILGAGAYFLPSGIGKGDSGWKALASGCI